MHVAATGDDDQRNRCPPAFVPCVEDAAYTRQLGRHPAAFQRALDAVSYRYLIATSRLAESPHGNSAAHARYAATLRENYERLWKQRAQVPKAARREWFETVMVHLYALNRLEVGLLWLLDHVHSREEKRDSTEYGPTEDTSPPASSADVATGSGPARKQSKGKKSAQDTSPLWFLWHDAQRHLHHLTLRLHTWTPAGGGAYAARAALRPADLARMDSSAFTWRVRLWVRVSCMVLTDSSASLCVCQPAEQEVSHTALCESFSGALTSSDFSFADDDPELCRVLRALTSSTPGDDARIIRRQLAGALLYRVLLETMLVRLRTLPRCLFTWRLLRDVLRSCASAASPLEHGAAITTAKNNAAVLVAMCAYIDAVVVPYLEQRDCHLGNSNHTATEIQVRFTQLSEQRMRALHTAAAAVTCNNQSAERAALLLSSSSAHEVLPLDSDGRLPEKQRADVRVALSQTLRRVCAYDVVAGTTAAAVADVLANDDDDDDNTPSPIDSGVPLAAEVMAAMQKNIALKQLDERLFHSESRRTRQLEAFLHHYFTQSPTLAFDRSYKGAPTDASSTAEEERMDRGGAQ